MISIRPAVETDIEILCSFDEIAQREEERRVFIRREVMEGNCYVAVQDGPAIGYGVLNYTFYYNGCIDMLLRQCGPSTKRGGHRTHSAHGITLPDAEAFHFDKPFQPADAIAAR